MKKREKIKLLEDHIQYLVGVQEHLSDQIDKLVSSNFESDKVKELKTEIAILQSQLEEQEAYKNNLVKVWQNAQDSLMKEYQVSKARARDLEEELETMKNSLARAAAAKLSVQPTRQNYTYSKPYTVKFDDHNWG